MINYTVFCPYCKQCKVTSITYHEDEVKNSTFIKFRHCPECDREVQIRYGYLLELLDAELGHRTKVSTDTVRRRKPTRRKIY